MKTTLFASTMLALSAAASLAVAQETPAAQETPEVPEAAEGLNVARGEPGKPGPGMAQVVFFRPKKYVGSVLKFSVRENSKGLCKLYNGSYCAIDFAPGVREFVINKDATRLELEAGETYYLLNKITMGVARGRPVLLPSDAATFQAAENLEVSTKPPTDADED